MKDEIVNLHGLKVIRISKNLSMDEMADIFCVSKAYISAVEIGIRNMRMQTLKYGLDNLGIDINDFYELETFINNIVLLPLDDEVKFRCMLLKSMAIIDFECKEELELVINSIINKPKTK